MPTWDAIQSGRRLGELQRRLGEAGRRDLQRKLRRDIRDAAGPVEADVRAAAMRVKVTSSKGGQARPSRSTGLRARTAGAVETKVTRRGVRIQVSAKKFGAYGRTLPKYLDAELISFKQHRHPVFGNRDVWVEQRGQPYFFVTIRHAEAVFHRAVTKRMDRALNDLTR